jgi:hypothetical protein
MNWHFQIQKLHAYAIRQTSQPLEGDRTLFSAIMDIRFECNSDHNLPAGD